MHIAHRSRHGAGWDVENLVKLRSIEIAVWTNANSRVSAPRDERWQPANLQLQANGDQQIGLAQLEQEAWFRLNEVRILIAFGERFHADVVAAHFLRQRRHVCRGRDYIKF